MFKKIVGFGDSWMYGDELPDRQNCFLSLLGRHYAVPVENFGIMGGSLDTANWTFLYWLEHESNPEECLVLHGLTNSYRFSHYNPNHIVYPNDPPWYRFVHSSWPANTAPKFESLIKHQTGLTDCPELRQLRYQESVFLFDGVSARRNIFTIQFNVFPEIDCEAPTLFTDWNLQSQITDLMPNGHPNEIGHQKIAQLLINYIDPAIIVA